MKFSDIIFAVLLALTTAAILITKSRRAGHMPLRFPILIGLFFITAHLIIWGIPALLFKDIKEMTVWVVLPPIGLGFLIYALFAYVEEHIYK